MHTFLSPVFNFLVVGGTMFQVEVEALVIQGPKLGTVISQVKKLEVSVLVLGQKKPSTFINWWVNPIMQSSPSDLTLSLFDLSINYLLGCFVFAFAFAASVEPAAVKNLWISA